MGMCRVFLVIISADFRPLVGSTCATLPLGRSMLTLMVVHHAFATTVLMAIATRDQSFVLLCIQ